MNLQRTLLAALMLSVVATSSAAVTPIDAFVGDAYEGFEGIISPGPYSGPMPILGATGTFDEFYGDPWIANSLYSGDGLYEVYPRTGNLMGLTPTGWTVFTFDTPVQRFGAYMAKVNDVGGGSVEFLDAEGLSIEALSFELPVGAWAWRGWESDQPVSSIVIHTGANPGTTAVYDDVEASYVPEPGALCLAAVGVAFMFRRRR